MARFADQGYPQQLLDEQVSEDELRELLERLAEAELCPPDVPTVAAIAEATDRSPIEVGRLLAEIRKEDIEERLGLRFNEHEDRIKELEERTRQLEQHKGSVHLPSLDSKARPKSQSPGHLPTFGKPRSSQEGMVFPPDIEAEAARLTKEAERIRVEVAEIAGRPGEPSLDAVEHPTKHDRSELAESEQHSESWFYDDPQFQCAIEQPTDASWARQLRIAVGRLLRQIAHVLIRGLRMPSDR